MRGGAGNCNRRRSSVGDAFTFSVRFMPCRWSMPTRGIQRARNSPRRALFAPRGAAIYCIVAHGGSGMRWLVALGFSLYGLIAAGEGAPLSVERGTTSFAPNGTEKNIPECYRLEPRRFDFTLTKKKELKLSGVDIYELTFPSPMASPHPENNTVYAEYYRPRGKGPFPCVIVFDITGGDQTLSRTIARQLAH